MLIRLQAGPQTETQTFGSFERHTRGMGSKLMVNMGYVKGGTLGRHAGGQLNPIQVRQASVCSIKAPVILLELPLTQCHWSVLCSRLSCSGQEQGWAAKELS